MFKTKIKISGLGLLVNHPVAIIYKALTEAGYQVDLKEFEGQFQDWDGNNVKLPLDEWSEKEAQHKTMEEAVVLEVNPVPWPG